MFKLIQDAYIDAWSKFFKVMMEAENRPELDEDVLNDILINNLKNSNTINKYASMSLIGCKSIIKSGNRAKQECGQKCIEGYQYCKRHIKQYDVGYVEGASAPSLVQQEREEEIDLERIYIRKNQFNNFVFGSTGFIIKSATEKYIVAKEGKDGEWLALTEEDKKEIKKKYKLRYKVIDFSKQGEKSNEQILKSVQLLRPKDEDEPMMSRINKIMSCTKGHTLESEE